MYASIGGSRRPSAPRKSRLAVRLTALASTVALSAVGLAVAATPSSAAVCNGYVALTFDDGPNSSTSALLSVLRANGARATMFNVGQTVQSNPSAARAQVDAGMWMANHSWNHAHMTSMNQSQMQSDLSQTNAAIQSATGVRPQLFRPPYGETNSTLQSVASSLGLRQVIWDVDSQDWNGASVSQIVSNASRLQAGQVILMHDGIQNTRNAIPQIMANLTSRNLCTGMISPSTGRAVAPDDTPPPTPADHSAADHASALRLRQPDRRQPVGSMHRRTQRLPEQRHPGTALRLPRTDQPSLDLHLRQTTTGVRQHVPRRSRLRQRRRRPDLRLPRPRQPAMERQLQRHHQQRPVRTLPGRLEHRQRSTNPALRLPRRHQPAIQPRRTMTIADPLFAGGQDDSLAG